MKKAVIILFIILFSITFCSRNGGSSERTEISGNISGRVIRIAVITDTQEEFAVKIREGLVTTFDGLLNKENSSAVYDIYDTELNKSRAAGILEEISGKTYDLVFAINYPTVFADLYVSKKLDTEKYKIVSENCIPIQSGVAASWSRPGGNITGVGVFVQFNSTLKLIKKLNPDVSGIAMYSWDAMGHINNLLENEIRKACSEEGIEFIEFRLISNQEEEQDYVRECNARGEVIGLIVGISAFVHKDGSPAYSASTSKLLRDSKTIINVSYDEIDVKDGWLAGTCVVWYDIGSQMADKGFRVIKGEIPGDISWDYPRKYNLIINMKRARDSGLEIPPEIVSGAYRIYTDYEGNYIGQGK